MTKKPKNLPEKAGGPSTDEPGGFARFPAQKASTLYPPLESGHPPAQIYCDLGQALYQLGLTAQQEGREETAQRCFSKASQAFLDARREHQEAGGSPGEAAVLLLYLILSRAAQNRYLDAFRAGVEALAADPNLAVQVAPHAHGLLNTDIARALSESDNTLREAAERPDVKPEASAMILNLLGRTHRLRGEYSQALAAYNEALKYNPDSVYVYQGLSDALWETGSRVEAIEAGQRALELAQQRELTGLLETITLQQAQRTLSLERKTEARALAEAGQELGGSQQAAFLLILSRIALQSDELNEAGRLASKAASQSGISAEQQQEAETLIAEIALARGEFAEAADLGKKALMHNPGYLPALLTHSTAVIQSHPPVDELTQAVRQLRFYVERQPVDLKTLDMLLDAMQQTGAPLAEQLAVSQRGLTLLAEPDQSVIRLRHADLLYQLERYQEAYNHLEQVRLEAQTPQWWMLRARSLWRLNRLEEAHNHFEAALKADPENLEWRKSYATFLGEIEVYDLARELWEQVLAADPQDQQARFDLTRLLLQMEEFEQAAGLSDQLLEADLPPEQYSAAVQLKGEALNGLAKPPEEIAQFYYGEALDAKDNNAYLEAVKLFEKAASFDPDIEGLYWEWIESLRMGSYDTTDPKRDAAMIAQALDLWQQAMEAGLRPTPDDSWIYVTRALINLKSQHLTPVQRAWEAILYLECAILLLEDEAYRWAALGHFYRQLNGQANALVATARALEIEPDYLWAIEERLIVIANTGDYPEAYRLAKQYQAQQEVEQGPEAAAQDPWIKSVLVFVLRHLAHEDPNYLQEALTYLEEENPDPFYREQRALMHQQMGEQDRTIAEYQKIWEAYDPLDEDNLVRYGYAGLMLGLLTDNPEPVDGAKFTFGKVLDDPTQRNEAYFSLGLCELYLARQQSGQTAADSVQRGLDYLLKEGIQSASDARTLEDFREYDWQPFKQHYASPPSGLPETIWQQAVERVNTALENRLVELRTLQSPVEELNQLTADLSREKDLDEVRRRLSEAAADATRVRLLKASGKWEAAARVARRLAESADFFPEPERVQTGVVKGLEASGDQLMLQGEPGLARLAYEQALKFLQQETAPIASEAAGLHSRLALMYLLGEQPGPAHEELTTALALTEDPEQASDLFANLAENLLQSPAEYWNLQDALEVCRVEFTQEGKTNLADALEAAREGAAAYLSHAFQMTEAEQDRTPLVTPVAVEYEQSLIPDESPLQETFLQDYLPAMRTRIWEHWGVFVPGVRMRPNEDLTSEAYRILIEETPILMDWVYLERVFAAGTPGELVALGVPESDQIQRQHPLTDQPGSWVPISYQASLAGHEVELTEPFEWMMYQLESVLLENLPSFLGVQETENLIFNWIEETHQVDQNQLFELLPDRNARVQFRKILRTLLDQQVPLTRPQDILDVIAQTGLSDLSGTVLDIRQKLKDLLPGNQPNARCQPVPGWIEDEMTRLMRTEYDRQVIAVPLDQIQSLLDELRPLADSEQPGQPVLIVEKHKLLRPLRSLMKRDMPRVQIICRAELLEGGDAHAR